MEHRQQGLRAALTSTVAVAAAVAAVTLVPTASADPAPAAPTVSERVGHLKPAAAGGVGTESTGGGARSGDFTTDLVHDILARDARNGQLKVYPHSGTYNGTATFQPATTINYGWASMRWIGQGELQGDGRNDVLYIDPYGVMRMAQHSGTWDGTNTLLPGVVVGTGWRINDLVYTDDFDADGFDDVLARRAGTGDVYWYRNSGLSGTAMFLAPQLVLSGTQGDIEHTMGDFTNDSVTDLLFVQSNGVLGLFNFVTEETWELGFGWQTINAITIADVNRDGVIDVLGRRKSDSALLAYTHTGTWSPQANGTAYGTLNVPVVIGHNWYINNVIT